MSIKLDHYSKVRSAKQGYDLHELISAEKDWLGEFFAGTVTRYRDLPRSIKSVARVASSEAVKAFVVRDGKVAVGVATLILGQTLLHPSNGAFFGTDLDYWLVRDANDETHEQTGRALIEASSRESFKQHVNPDASHPGIYGVSDDALLNYVFATTPTNTDYNRGLHNFLAQAGEPSVLSSGTEGDPYGITKDQSVLQLYAANFLVSKAAGDQLEITFQG